MYKKCEHIHFIGIGGIGMSGIAEILRLQGYKVSGCDEAKTSKTLEHLRSLGCTIMHKHDKDHVKDAEVVVYSSAVQQDNPEVVAALERGIPVIPRAIMLAEIMRSKYSITVSGAHGKTTTTSLISHVLIETDNNPTVIVGGILKNIANNAQLGKGALLIAEADESDRSLLYLNPTMAVVTNIDAEHLDTYKDIEDIKKTFKYFLARLPFYGKAFVCIDDPNIQSILPLPHISTIKYGLSDKADFMGKIIELAPSYSIFDVYNNKAFVTGVASEPVLLGRVKVNIPGIHNVLNSLATISVCLEVSLSFEKIAAALESFKGVERRFEFKGTYKGTEIFDDYGHHPTEIKHTLVVAQRRAKRKLHVIFQPHRFSRTQKLWNDFVDLFANASNEYNIETLYITDIYPASEQPIPGITSEKLVEAIKSIKPDLKIYHRPTYSEITEEIKAVLQPDDMLLTIGAGKVNQVGEALVEMDK